MNAKQYYEILKSLSRRNFLRTGSAAVATTLLAKAGTLQAQERNNTEKAEHDSSISDPGQENKSLPDTTSRIPAIRISFSWKCSLGARSRIFRLTDGCDVCLPKLFKRIWASITQPSQKSRLKRWRCCSSPHGAAALGHLGLRGSSARFFLEERAWLNLSDCKKNAGKIGLASCGFSLVTVGS